MKEQRNARKRNTGTMKGLTQNFSYKYIYLKQKNL